VTPRDTRTGGVLEAMIVPALKRGGYEHRIQELVGTRLGGRKHKVDCVATKAGRRVLVSLKWQQSGGTAEQKVPFEVMCLAEARAAGAYDGAYVVLGGDGWTLRDFYTSGELEKHLTKAKLVSVVTLERFIAMANKGEI
jgi:PD-(D/E)XK nuclease superfamily protein